MAMYGGAWIYKDLEIMLMIDPNRYRVTIWERSKRHPEIRSVKVKRLHDKDRKHILKRAREWIDKEYKK